MVPLSLLGVFPIGPENFLCALLRCEANKRFIPVWLPPFEGGRLMARLSGWESNRPTAEEVLADVLRSGTKGVESIHLSSYYNGVFMASITLADGTQYDARPSDALNLAVILDVPVEADESVVAQASLRLNTMDALNYFNLELDNDRSEGESASGDAAADAEFAELMRNLGVEELSDGFESGEDEASTEPDDDI
ncbi:bifunctional nuclease family protein [Corynebacterium mayonis]|uniref:bifunctional nuclease family protein n=1 Tax=Corynebacterium mayonis TaxID=3062461 RepID=UPI0031401281